MDILTLLFFDVSDLRGGTGNYAAQLPVSGVRGVFAGMYHNLLALSDGRCFSYPPQTSEDTVVSQLARIRKIGMRKE